MATLQDEIRRSAIAKLLQDRMSPQTTYGPTTNYTGEDQPFPESLLPSNSAQGNDTIYQVSPESYNDPFFEGTNNPIYSNIPGKIADEGVQAMYHTPSSTYTPDMNNPSTVDQLSNDITATGENPNKVGIPSLQDRIKARQEKEKASRPKALNPDEIAKVMLNHGLEYDETKSPMDNWNTAIASVNDPTKQSMREALNPQKPEQTTATQKDVAYISKLFGIPEQEAFDRMKQTMHKPREAYVAEAYKSAIAGYRDEPAAQKIAEDAGKFYDTVYGQKSDIASSGQTQPQLNDPLAKYRGDTTTQQQQPAGQVTREQAIAELKRRGKI